ncbi:MAG: hypothetical protein methR_P2063 [Methyloprofundus sp.]|nr:MAG: hypothetical protein methR_P2063 [Methyloprofundus sp.]
MYTYLSLLFNICLFKSTPQDIPYSRFILRLSVASYALVSYLLIQLSVNDLQALLQVGVEIVLILIFTYLILTISNNRGRYTQTASALLGTDTLISALALPVIGTLSIDNNNLLAILTMLALMVWHWLVTAHIIRHALSQSFLFATGIAFLYIFSSYQIMGVLFPHIGTPN